MIDNINIKKDNLSTFHRALKNGYVSIKGDFLLPPEYSVGHEHQWTILDAGFCICQLCGFDHVCFLGECPVVTMEHSEHVCSISGCVILKSEMRPEWGAMERTTGSGGIRMGEEEDCDDANHYAIGNVNYEDDDTEDVICYKKRKTHYMRIDNHINSSSNSNSKPILHYSGNYPHRHRPRDHCSHGSEDKRAILKPPLPHDSCPNMKRRDYYDHNLQLSSGKDSKSKRGRRRLAYDSSAVKQQAPFYPVGIKMKRRGRASQSSSQSCFFMNKWSDNSNPDAHQHKMKKVLKGSMEVYEFVEMVVRDIMDSQKTLQCREEEMARDKTRKIACLAKIMRENLFSCSEYHEFHLQRPNLIDMEAKLSWLCRKCRYHSYYYQDRHAEYNDLRHNLGKKHIALDSQPKYVTIHNVTKKKYLQNERKSKIYETQLKTGKNAPSVFQTRTAHVVNKRSRMLERVIRICVENITRLIRTHGWHRVHRQLQHATRGKEFVCSMLYLMRMGITFRNQNILQKVEVLNDLLPMQVFLPSVFNIRAKSITEGENLIKMDIQRMPLAS